MGALSHLRVLDLSRVLAGPWAGQVLADLGAEVIKVERPGRGDDTRGWAPPYMPNVAGEATTESAYFSAANRGKRSITVDITHADGQALIRRLAAESDILLENYKVGNLAKYGLDYASLEVDHPELIYCSITGFGQDGPYRDRPGYDFMIQALSGLMSITGERDDRPGGGPQKVGIAIADILTGMYASVAVLAALAYRERTGRGQHIDLALLDVQVACLANQAMNYLASGVAPERLGNAHPNIVPYQAFASADGHLIVAVGNDDQFARLARLLDRPEWSADPRYATNAARVAHRDELVAMLAPLFALRDTDAWLAALEQARIPCGPINTLAQVFADPQVRHRGARIELPHPTAGHVPLVANPMKFSESPVEYDMPPPLLGQHTDDVLGELLGMDIEQLADLRARGIVA